MLDVGMVDPLLLHLADREDTYVAPILHVARVQNVTYVATRHVLAVNDQFIRRKLLEAGQNDSLPDFQIRCLRCNAAANLKDWERAGKMDEGDRAAMHRAIRGLHGEEWARFLLPCDGDKRAIYALVELENLVETAE